MSKVANIVVDILIKSLEEGKIPWRKPWKGGGKSSFPQNLKTKTVYSGINHFVLSVYMEDKGYTSPYFLSYKQATAMGGQVKKGEKGYPVIFAKTSIREQENSDGEMEKKTMRLLRYYTVFNVEQIDGIEDKIPKSEPIDETTFNPIAECEKVVDGMPQKPGLVFNEQRAYYSPSKDEINMPKKETFTSAEEYYSTLFHELVHSTGHDSRLDRLKKSPFGSTDYSKEELVAEMGSAFLCTQCGIEAKTIENSKAYIKGWLGYLRSADNKTAIISAGSQAQKAYNFIVNEEKGE
jgi:antirestriction protein ArdC